MMKEKPRYHHHCYMVVAFTIILVTIAVSTPQNYNTKEAIAQIESNSTLTTCVNGKCVITTTTCIINQPCHTVRSNATNTNDNNSTTNDNNNNNGNNIVPAPFDQGTI
jgi:hypothetical protein